MDPNFYEQGIMVTRSESSPSAPSFFGEMWNFVCSLTQGVACYARSFFVIDEPPRASAPPLDPSRITALPESLPDIISVIQKPLGIRNEGNTCFGDALFVMFLTIPYLLNQGILKLKLEDLPATRAFVGRYLTKAAAFDPESREAPPSIRGIGKVMDELGLGGRAQHDASEAMSLLFESLQPDSALIHKMVKTKKYDLGPNGHNSLPTEVKKSVNAQGVGSRKVEPDYNVIVDLRAKFDSFEALLENTLIKTEDGKERYNFEYLDQEGTPSALPLPIIGTSHLYPDLPPQMILTLGRYEYSMSGRYCQKKKIKRPIDISDQFIIPPELHEGGDRTGLYQIDGFIVHSGGLSGGHYIGYLRNSEGQWSRVNDDRVTPVSEDVARKDLSKCYFFFAHLDKELNEKEIAAHKEKRAQDHKRFNLEKNMDKLKQGKYYFSSWTDPEKLEQLDLFLNQLDVFDEKSYGRAYPILHSEFKQFCKEQPSLEKVKEKVLTYTATLTALTEIKKVEDESMESARQAIRRDTLCQFKALYDQATDSNVRTMLLKRLPTELKAQIKKEEAARLREESSKDSENVVVGDVNQEENQEHHEGDDKPLHGSSLDGASPDLLKEGDADMSTVEDGNGEQV